MEQPKSKPKARHQTSVFQWREGLDGANHTRAPGGGKTMFLTSPFIDQAIALKTPFKGSMSVIAILRHLPEAGRLLLHHKF
jgi:hypothetical protein